MVKTSASVAVDLGLIPCQVKPIISRFSDQQYWDSVENKLASLLIVLVGKAAYDIPSS